MGRGVGRIGDRKEGIGIGEWVGEGCGYMWVRWVLGVKGWVCGGVGVSGESLYETWGAATAQRSGVLVVGDGGVCL